MADNIQKIEGAISEAYFCSISLLGGSHTGSGSHSSTKDAIWSAPISTELVGGNVIVVDGGLAQLPSNATDYPGNNPSVIQVHVTSAKKDTIGSYPCDRAMIH